jgi:hypothetical protein
VTPRALFRSLALASLLALAATSAFAAVTITIINMDGPGEGFNDPTPAAPVGGNPGTTIGDQRLFCFQQAAAIWGSTLTSSVPIQIQAAFNPLTCTATSAVLGSAGPRFVEANYPSFEFQGYWYHEALANKEAGVDLTPPSLSDNGSDINAQFNSNLGATGCLTGIGWYYGFDHNEGTQIDLLAVLLHEFGHGLGFSTVTSGTSGNFLSGLPAVWDKFLYDETTGLHWDQNTPAQRVASAINTGNLTWDGYEVNITGPGYLSHSPEVAVPFGSGSLAANPAAFGGALTLAGVSGPAVVVSDAGALSTGCTTPFLNAGSLAGAIAVIDRGTCTFVIKAKNAQDAGAIGCILVNNVAGALSPSGVDPTITIPVVAITQADGATLKSAILGGPTNVSLRLSPTNIAGLHPSGHVRMYSPNPFQGGSSVSHWDVSATPNLLMEPAINADLTDNLDLTIPLFKDIGWLPRTVPTATQLSLVSAYVEAGQPHLAWFSPDGANERMTLYRRVLPGDWASLGDIYANGTGMLFHVDTDAVPGGSYEYRIGIQTSTGEKMFGQVLVNVPLESQFALKRLAGNSAGAPLAFSVTLLGDGPATIELLDVSGRRLAQRSLQAMGAGAHRVELDTPAAAGVYWARLTQAARSLTAGVVILK